MEAQAGVSVGPTAAYGALTSPPGDTLSLEGVWGGGGPQAEAGAGAASFFSGHQQSKANFLFYLHTKSSFPYVSPSGRSEKVRKNTVFAL